MNIDALKAVRENFKMGYALSFAEAMLIQQAIDSVLQSGNSESFNEWAIRNNLLIEAGGLLVCQLGADIAEKAWDAAIQSTIAAAPAVSDGWIPVSERMPELYKFDIWVFSPSKGVVDGVSYDGHNFMDDECQFTVNDATHWMPKIYPDAPKVKP